MRVLMLGWEFPPFITGGLGTACYGLTRALDRRGIEVVFVLPKSVEGEHASHVTLVSPGRITPAVDRSIEVQRVAPVAGVTTAPPTAPPVVPPFATFPAPGANDPAANAGATTASGTDATPSTATATIGSAGASDGASPGGPTSRRFAALPLRPSGWLPPRIGILGETTAPSVYSSTPVDVESWTRALYGNWGSWSSMGSAAGPAAGFGSFGRDLLEAISAYEAAVREAIPEAGRDVHDGGGGIQPRGDDYSGDLIGTADRYARFVVATCAGMDFDVIHAHDWLTYPAGIAMARLTGRPLVVHVHSTEFDRSGEHVNQRIYDIERRGMHASIKVVTVSMLTKNLCVNRYGVPADRIEVVYNGVDLAPEQVGMEDIRPKDKIVLYFGRITMQKGPEYFIHAAKRVLDVFEDVKFVVAGSGDQAQRMIELAAGLGIGHKVLFTGFLRGKDIARVFALADLYVMPSVSEPFGIAPLEAMGHDVPVLISRTSGVSEVLTHALKCDFWDVDDMANKIVAVLRHPPLQRTLVEHGRFEVRKLTWDGAADRCEQVYHQAIAALGRRR